MVVQTSLAASLVLQGGQDVKSRFQAGLQCIKSMPLAAHQVCAFAERKGVLFDPGHLFACFQKRQMRDDPWPPVVPFSMTTARSHWARPSLLVLNPVLPCLNF